MSQTLQFIHSACTAQARLATPLGAMLLARTATGLAGAWFDGQQHHPGELAAPHRVNDPLLRDAMQQLTRYFAGESHTFKLPLDLHGTAFQCRVWRALQEIAAGATLRYGDVASRIGAATASRAVGAAVGRNPLSVIVPCHRVLGAAGALTGYAGGLDRKVALLDLERRKAPQPTRTQPIGAFA
jgi:methylated-DNA-[protein]-cysteine S-methyltransferase